MGDKYTMEYLIEYLKSDNYELIKNLGAIINKDNVSEVYQYREGALSRNEALIKILKEVIATSTFVNRKTNTVQQVVKS